MALAEVERATGQRVELATFPINFFFQHRVEIEAKQEPAREVLVRALAASGRALSWRLFSTPGCDRTISASTSSHKTLYQPPGAGPAWRSRPPRSPASSHKSHAQPHDGSLRRSAVGGTRKTGMGVGPDQVATGGVVARHEPDRRRA